MQIEYRGRYDKQPASLPASGAVSITTRVVSVEGLQAPQNQSLGRTVTLHLHIVQGEIPQNEKVSDIDLRFLRGSVPEYLAVPGKNLTIVFTRDGQLLDLPEAHIAPSDTHIEFHQS